MADDGQRPERSKVKESFAYFKALPTVELLEEAKELGVEVVEGRDAVEHVVHRVAVNYMEVLPMSQLQDIAAELGVEVSDIYEKPDLCQQVVKALNKNLRKEADVEDLLESFTKDQLISNADRYGIEVKSRWTKKAIAEKIIEFKYETEADLADRRQKVNEMIAERTKNSAQQELADRDRAQAESAKAHDEVRKKNETNEDGDEIAETGAEHSEERATKISADGMREYLHTLSMDELHERFQNLGFEISGIYGKDDLVRQMVEVIHRRARSKPTAEELREKLSEPQLVQLAKGLGIEAKSHWTEQMLAEIIAETYQIVAETLAQREVAEAEAAQPKTKLEELESKQSALQVELKARREKVAELYGRSNDLENRLDEIVKEEVAIQKELKTNDDEMDSALATYQKCETNIVEIGRKIRRLRHEQHRQMSQEPDVS